MERIATTYKSVIGEQETTVQAYVDDVNKKADIKAYNTQEIMNIRNMSTSDINALISVLQQINGAIQEPITIQANVTPASPGEQDGAIIIAASGGVYPLNIEWSNGFSNTTAIDDLSTGTYTVTVTDIFGTQTTKNFQV